VLVREPRRYQKSDAKILEKLGHRLVEKLNHTRTYSALRFQVPHLLVLPISIYPIER
jgi:hypothetical protein